MSGYNTSREHSDDEGYDDECDKCQSRMRLMDYLYEDEADDLRMGYQDFTFRAGELTLLLEENKFGDDSSFNDDGIPDSEAEYFSSEYDESDVGDYIPPLTRTKKNLIYQLAKYQFEDDDDDEVSELKQIQRNEALTTYQARLLKKRAAKAFRRLSKVDEMELDDIGQETFFLEKLEVVDKKLNRPFYYEEDEPSTYKKLLHKRKKAIRRKYEEYSLSPKFRCDYKHRVLSRVGKKVAEEAMRSVAERNIRRDSTLDSTSVYHSFERESGTCDEVFETAPDCIDSEEQEKDDEIAAAEHQDGDTVSASSSFYDDMIPDSELEYFSSDFEEDCSVAYPGAESRTLKRYRRYLIKCRPTFVDGYEEELEKKIRQADVEAQFKNYLERKRAFKALARAKIVSSMNIRDPQEEAIKFLDLEIIDKKLNRAYYYGEDEPDIYKVLLAKRRRAIIRKYQRFAKDKKFHDELKRNIYMKVLRTQPSPMFDEPDSDFDEESSFNDTEVPTSEEEFLSNCSLELPFNYEKPTTRTKAALYEDLEEYEADNLLDTPSVIYEKRRLRLDIIQKFKNDLMDRRRMKALARLEDARQMGVREPAVMANRLKELEIADKKLNRGYYYSPGEPEEFTEFLFKRLRAIDRKYQAYVENKNFRDEYEYRIISSIRKPKKDVIPGDLESIVWESFGGESHLTAPIYKAESMHENDKKKERRRDYRTAGVWPKYRDSAPPVMDFAGDPNRNITSGYGSGLVGHSYYEAVLRGERVG